MGKVASRSTLELFKIKLTCKELRDAADDDSVFQHASFDVLALVPLPWFKRQEELSFLKRCEKMGNLEILYREGMVQYFTSLNGIHTLKKAALKGHHDAKYVYSMILMSSEDEAERSYGFDLFRSLKKSTCITRCRKRVKALIRSMWMNNPVVPNPRRLSLCRSNTCDSVARLHEKLTTRRWSSLDEDYDIVVSCEYCCGDYEFRLFSNMFRV